MTPTQLFQKRHGARWAAIARGPELTDALLTVNAGLFEEILALTPEQIASPSGNVILAKLQGQLKHEQALVNLSEIHPDILNDLPESDYADPQDEAEQAADAQDQATGGSFHEWIAAAPAPLPQPKRRKKRKTK